MLLANTLLEVNKNMRQDYEDQVDYLYNDLYDFCSQQKRHVMKLIDKAKTELAMEKTDWWTVNVKETMFNQHLTQAKFGGETLVKNPELVEPMLYLNRKTRKLSELTKTDYKDMLQNLFADKFISEIVTLPGNRLFGKEDADYEAEKAAEDYEMLHRRIAKCFTDNLPNVPKDFADFHRDYGDSITFRPLFKMAELNGMFVTTNDEEPMLLRAADKEFAAKARHELFEMDEARRYEIGPLVCKQHETDPYLFVVTWQKVEDQIDWRLKCNYEEDEKQNQEAPSSYKDELFRQYIGDSTEEEFTPWDELGGINYEYKA
jgi:heme-degrading monooxygenase HmoA